MTITIQSRTIDGALFLSATDLVDGLRGRAEEIEAAANAMGDDLDAEQYEVAVAYHTAATELRERADWIDLACITHLTERPGDST